MESTDSSAGSPRRHQPNLPPGFRFHPTDEELVVHYLKKKASSAPLPVAIIAEVDLYKFDPWELPAKATFGEQEWYFFSPRDRKYPNGARPNRAATSGYWKATGTDKPVLSSGGTQKVGVKKALVFYGGKPPKGIKTNWIMHEYRLADSKAHNRPPGCHDPASKKNSLRLDDWVLCRIYKKSNASRPLDHHHHDHDHHDSIIVDDMLGGGVGPIGNHVITPMSMMSVMAGQVGPQGINDHHLFDGILSSAATANSLPSPSPSPSGPAKRAALPGAYWNADADDDDAGPSKRLIMPMDHRHGGGSGGADQFGAAEAENNNVDVNGCHAAAAASSSLATLLSQLPAAAQTPGAAVLGAMGVDGGLFQRPFPLPGMNWYSN